LPGSVFGDFQLRVGRQARGTPCRLGLNDDLYHKLVALHHQQFTTEMGSGKAIAKLLKRYDHRYRQ
jgi:hypothetical protein